MPPDPARLGRFAPLGIAAFGVVSVVAAGMMWQGGPAGPPRIDADDPQQVARGAVVYAEHCAACHGVELEGETPDWRQRKPDGTLPAPPHDASGHTWHHSDEMLFMVTKHGGDYVAPGQFVSGMPAFGDVLSDADIAAVLAFIKNSWPQDIRERQARMNE